jgi:hypothetical protein
VNSVSSRRPVEAKKSKRKSTRSKSSSSSSEGILSKAVSSGIKLSPSTPLKASLPPDKSIRSKSSPSSTSSAQPTTKTRNTVVGSLCKNKNTNSKQGISELFNSYTLKSPETVLSSERRVEVDDPIPDNNISDYGPTGYDCFNYEDYEDNEDALGHASLQQHQ